MWLITTFGFFSVVQKPNTKHLTIRARVRSDLQALKATYLPTMGPIQDSKEIGKHTDYRFRATASHEDVANAMAAAIRDIGYGNFKSAVGERQDYERAGVYSEVWGCLNELQGAKFQHESSKASAAKSNLTPSYGTVVFDPTTKRVLLRAPTNEYGGMKWTLAKGRPRKNEQPEATALRETLEETGVRCRIVAPIPGEYPGQTTISEYWLAVPLENSKATAGDETGDVCWVTPEMAAAMIAESTNKAGAARDIEVLNKAMQMVAEGVIEW